MIGRKTNGGFVITSSPLLPEPVVNVNRDALADEAGEGDGDDGGEADGDGDAAGSGGGGPRRGKPAHGGGWIKPAPPPQRVWWAGTLPRNALTFVAKISVASVAVQAPSL